MGNQAFNPYLPSWEYIPDGEPYVFNGRVYVYGSHDRFDGAAYCMNDYVTWSAPLDDLANWRYEGVIYRTSQDPRADSQSFLYAPDMAQGVDGKFYLYYALNNRDVMGVAVADTPVGPFEYYGTVQGKDGAAVGERPGDMRNFDPGVLVDDDGRVFLYSGFAPRKPSPDQEKELDTTQKNFLNRNLGSYCMELESDMLTVKRGPFLMFKRAGDCDGTAFFGHEFFEASSLRKVKLPEWEKPKYYFIYSSINSHELCYAVSDKPDSDFEYGGVIISNGDVREKPHVDEVSAAKEERRAAYGIHTDTTEAYAYMGNNHGSIVEINGQWYIFYHRQTNLHQFSRQDCAEPITISADGRIAQVEITSCGLNIGADGANVPLNGWGNYNAGIACNLYMPNTVMWFPFNGKREKDNIPYITQDGADYDPDAAKADDIQPRQYIANFQEGAVAGFKYFAVDNSAHLVKKLAISVRGSAKGTVIVSPTPHSAPYSSIPIDINSAEWQTASGSCELPDGKTALFFQYTGTGAFDLMSFSLEDAH